MAKGEATLLLKIKTAGQEALKSIEDSFGTLKTAALGAFALISGVIVKSVADYREQEIATNALTQAMVNNGNYSKQLKDDYLAQAAAIQKVTLFGDEQVIAAQAAVQAQIGEHKITKELSLAIADLAQAKGMDLVSAAQLVGKTIGSSNNVLARQGVEFDNNTRGAERLAAVTDALNGKFGGQATAATSGLGAMKQLMNVVSDLMETFGEKLAPFINLAANALKSFASDTSNSTPIMDLFIDSLKFVTMIVLQAYEGVKELGIVIGVGLATAVEAASAALSGEFSRAIDIVKEGNKTISEELLKSQAENDAAITAVFAASEQANRDSLAKEEADLKQSLENKKNLKLKMSEEEKTKYLADAEAAQALKDIDNELVLAKIQEQHTKELELQLKKLEMQYKNEENFQKKKDLLKQISDQKEKVLESQKNDLLTKDRESFYNKMSSLQGSSNQALAAAGKAAAIRQIAIDTPVAITKALAAFPPPFNFAAAALVGIAAAEQAGKVAGIGLAEGGIVKATPGGIQATIGEGGRDEAVIPLENGQIPGSSGGGVTIIVYGGLLGDERTAQEFAGAVDRELLKLRQNGGSVAFDRIN